MSKKANVLQKKLSKKTIVVSSLVFALLLAFGATWGFNSFAQTPSRLTIYWANDPNYPFRIQGYLKNGSTGNGISGATIYLETQYAGSVRDTVWTTKTSSSGYFGVWDASDYMHHPRNSYHVHATYYGTRYIHSASAYTTSKWFSN